MPACSNKRLLTHIGTGTTGVYAVSYDPARSQVNPFRVRMPDGKQYVSFPHKRAAANFSAKQYPNGNDEE